MYAQPQVNYVGKQESLVDDLISVLNELNLDFDEDAIRNEGRVNESGRAHGKPVVWDKGLKDEASRLEYAAFKRYDYGTDNDRHCTEDSLYMNI